MYCLLLTNTDKGCIVRMATCTESKVLSYDVMLCYELHIEMVLNYIELRDYHSAPDGSFSHTAYELQSILQGGI